MADNHADKAALDEYWRALQAKRADGPEASDSGSFDTTTPMALTFDPQETR